MPDIGIAKRENLPDELPDYDYDLELQDGQLTVKGKCTTKQCGKYLRASARFRRNLSRSFHFARKPWVCASV